MRFNILFAGTILSLMISNANAFSSIKIAFPQGYPEEVTIDTKTSTGKCAIPADTVNCSINRFSATLPVLHGSRHIFEEVIQGFSNEHANKLVENLWDTPINYMKLTITGQNNVCYIDLLQSKTDIVINLNKDGSCYQ